MSDSLAQVMKVILDRHPGAVYVGLVHAKQAAVRFGVAFHFRTHHGTPVYAWHDDVTGMLVMSATPPTY